MSLSVEKLLLLDDPITRRLLLTFNDVFRTAKQSAGYSPGEVAAEWAQVAGCTLEEALGRAKMFFQLGLIGAKDEIDADVTRHLQRFAINRIVELDRNADLIASVYLKSMESGELMKWLELNLPDTFASSKRKARV